MLKYLATVTLICLPIMTFANNLPFVGKRKFAYTIATGDIPGSFYGSGGYTYYIEIKKINR